MAFLNREPLMPGVLRATALATLLATVSMARADIGLGVMVGDPTGLSLKINRFPVLGINWDLDDHLYLHADYWVANPTLQWPIKAYVGLGVLAVVKSGEEDNLDAGGRIPLGLQAFLAKEIELFGEVVPVVRVIPDSRVDIDGALGLRFHF